MNEGLSLLYGSNFSSNYIIYIIDAIDTSLYLYEWIKWMNDIMLYSYDNIKRQHINNTIAWYIFSWVASYNVSYIIWDKKKSHFKYKYIMFIHLNYEKSGVHLFGKDIKFQCKSLYFLDMDCQLCKNRLIQ